MWEWLDRVAKWLLDYWPGHVAIGRDVVKYLVATSIIAVGGFLLFKLQKAFRTIIVNPWCCWRIRNALQAVKSDSGVWISRPPMRPPNYLASFDASIPIITFGNLKGGVGKTTVAANVAGLLAMQGEDVLLIDFDFQGSLSSMMLGERRNARRPRDGELSLASQLLLGAGDGQWLVANATWEAHEKLYAVPAFYDLARIENRLLVEWLLEPGAKDQRYRLHTILQSMDVQRRYSIVIIDAAPRLTASTIQALCASTHIIIPTVMDQLSAEAVKTFVTEIETLRGRDQDGLCPRLRHLGVVGNMLPGGQATWHVPTVNALGDALRGAGHVELLDESTWIRDLPALSRAAGDRIGVLGGGDSSDRSAIEKAICGLVQHIRMRAAPKRR